MSLSEISRETILKAITEFDRIGRDAFLKENGFRPARSYFLKLGEKLYDSKAIVGVAHGFVSPSHRRLRGKDFTGGEATVEALLISLGFQVVRDAVAPPTMEYEIGATYSRRKDIHAIFGGQERGGITTPQKGPFIFLFTGEAGEQHGYSDGWSDGLYLYTGEGQQGAMVFVRGNRAILQHRERGKDLLLFEALKQKGNYRFVGSFECVGWREEQRPDREGNERSAIIFELLPNGVGFSEGDGVTAQAPSALPLTNLRARAYQSATVKKSTSSSVRSIHVRSQHVKDYVLARAKGICESCAGPAPFTSKSGTPYLEPHHIDRLADGGLDKPDVVGAICPNCHREIHHGARGSEINEALRQKIKDLEIFLDEGRSKAVILGSDGVG